MAHNAGGGHAVNVFYFDVNLTRAVAIGSLAAGEERVLPQAVNELLQDGGAGRRHIVVTEAPYTRTMQWTTTLNLRTQEAGAHRGQVLHRFPAVVQGPPSDSYQSLADYMTANRKAFHTQLSDLTEEGLGPRLLKKEAEDS